MYILLTIALLMLAVIIYYGRKFINKPVTEPVSNNYSEDIEKLLNSSEEQTMILKAMVNKSQSPCKFEKQECKGCDLSKILIGQEELKALQLTQEKVREVFESTTLFLEKQ